MWSGRDSEEEGMEHEQEEEQEEEKELPPVPDRVCNT